MPQRRRCRPFHGQRVANQNLQSYATPDLLIVTAGAWEQEAKRLAGFRAEHDQLETQVVTTDQIYNEFSGGKPDITAIRDFVRQLYTRDPKKLKYLLLFGDATYDYKNLCKTSRQTSKTTGFRFTKVWNR